MTSSYEQWLAEVKAALRSINMDFDEWQNLWPFNFQREFHADVGANDAAVRANRFWWQKQNMSLDRDCRKTPDCWLPRGHQGSCEPVSTPIYERGDLIKVEFDGENGMPSEWMWVIVESRDDKKQIVYGRLDNEPVNDYMGEIRLGSELAVSFAQIREHRKSTKR